MGKIKDLTNKRFGRLIVKSITRNDKHQLRWECVCDCGTVSLVRQNSLVSGLTISCGCFGREVHSKDHTGARFGSVVAIKRIPRSNSKGPTKYLCKCDCGIEKLFSIGNLRGKDNVSCGCKLSSIFKKVHSSRWAHYKGEASKRGRYNSYLHSAKKNNREFSITIDQFCDLAKQDCYYCGSKPSNVSRGVNGDFVYNGMDRRDNSKGYTVENCIPCCGPCNKAKLAMTESDFIQMAHKIAAKHPNYTSRFESWFIA